MMPVEGDSRAATQAPHEVRAFCARLLDLPEPRVRVVMRDTGGGFGQKVVPQREDMCIMLAARKVPAALKWIEDRRENLLSAGHARHESGTARLAFDGDGAILAAQIDLVQDVGAYPTPWPVGTAAAVGMLFPGPYRVPHATFSATCVFTNTSGRTAYRGPWQFESVAREVLRASQPPMTREQYLSFQTHLQGMIAPPDCEPAVNAVPRQGIVESNMLMKKLGPVFTTTSVTKPPVAMLFSLSNCMQGQVQDVHKNLYVHNLPHGHTLPLAYLSGRLIQQPFLTVLDEDVVDGTLASDHKAVVLTAIDYLDPDVVKALESFIEQGGLVLLTADCTVAIKGATKLAVKAAMPDQEIIDKLHQDKKYDQTGPYTTTAKHIEGATPLAKALKAELDKKGIKPVLETDVPSIRRRLTTAAGASCRKGSRMAASGPARSRVCCKWSKMMDSTPVSP